MALEAGGYAEKFGNRYEANWVAYLLLRLLDEKILSVTVEPIGDDEKGVDVIVENLNGEKEYHQCKAGSADNEHWSIAKLNEAQILENALFHIQRGLYEFHIVSPLTYKALSDLSESSLNTNGNATDFYDFQIAISQKRKKLFDDLCKYLSLNPSNESDLNQAIILLQRFKITPYIPNSITSSNIEDKAEKLFSGPPQKLLNFLKNYPVELNKLRVAITTPMLLSDLKDNNFEHRITPDDERISPIIEQLSYSFSSSIKPYLISDSLIQRCETDQIITSSNKNAVTLIKAESGMGKSALMLEIHEKIQLQGSISIPIRLDKTRPENNADAFGIKLGFPYSPVLCLSRFARNQKTIFLLDQLDAIRWTATHSNNALQVCQQIVRQVLALRKDGMDVSIILACRNFDLDEDVPLSSWIKGLGDEVSEICLSHLEIDTVRELIKPFETFDSLPEAKKKILTIPLWLSIYLVIAKRIKSAPKFSNKLELVKQFWDDRIKEAISIGVNEDNAVKLIEEIVVMMNSKSRLTISENIISIGSPQTLEALLSVGILSRQSQQISFRHQALFDYQVGIRLFNEARISPEQLLNTIGDYSQQTLTKREHLKYALNMLLDFDQKIFCSSILVILTSDKIRFHLKYLALNSIRELTNLKTPAKEMLKTIVNIPVLLTSFISQSCYNNHHIITILSELNIISQWLNSDDTELVEKTARLLSSIAETSPNVVLKELTPFIDQSDKWNNIVYSGLCWDMEKDSDAMFEVRKQLINLNCHVSFIDWKTLSNHSPSRSLDLLEMILDHYKISFGTNRYSEEANIETFTNRDLWSESTLDELSNISSAIPKEALSRLLLLVNEFVGVQENDDMQYNWLYKDNYSCHETIQCLAKAVFKIIESASKQLSTNSKALLELLLPYFSSSSRVMVHLVGKSLLNLPVDYSNTVIEWMIDDPKSKLSCGNDYIEPQWLLPGKIIEKFSQNCSDKLFKELETIIYYSGPTRNIDDIKWRLEASRDGRYYSYWGETQYFLLPKLDDSRSSLNSKQLIDVLNRKFADYTNDDFCSVHKNSGGLVTSPLPLGNVLSDKAWKKLILSPRERANRGTWIQRGTDVVSESSIQQFSRNLDTAARNQPIRFANLALTLPSNIDEHYIKSFYGGLAQVNIDNISEEYRNEWKACPPKLAEKVIVHFNNTNCEYELARIFETRISEQGWSENSMDMLIDLALHAIEPVSDTLYVRDIKESLSADESNAHTLRNKAINCTRGIAFTAISRLFWKDEQFAIKSRNLIQSAINDPHPAVNIVALDLLAPMLNYDDKYALEMFLILCSKDLRMACGYGAHYFFNEGFGTEFQDNFIKLVLKMLQSSSDEVKKEAARQIFARWFFNNLFEEEIKQVLHGDDRLREGVASVMKQFLAEDKHHNLLYKLPSIYAQLVNDDNVDILRSLGGSIRNDTYWNKTISKELFTIYVSSKAALYNLYGLFDVIEKHSGSLLEYKDQLLQLVVNITSSNASRRDMHVKETSLINVLQRLYDESTEDEDTSGINICLDIWDKLLYSEFYSAISASKELETGLLS